MVIPFALDCNWSRIHFSSSLLCDIIQRSSTSQGDDETLTFASQGEDTFVESTFGEADGYCDEGGV
jgi:hypothetical protein